MARRNNMTRPINAGPSPFFAPGTAEEANATMAPEPMAPPAPNAFRDSLRRTRAMDAYRQSLYMNAMNASAPSAPAKQSAPARGGFQYEAAGDYGIVPTTDVTKAVSGQSGMGTMMSPLPSGGWQLTGANTPESQQLAQRQLMATRAAGAGASQAQAMMDPELQQAIDFMSNQRMKQAAIDRMGAPDPVAMAKVNAMNAWSQAEGGKVANERAKIEGEQKLGGEKNKNELMLGTEKNKTDRMKIEGEQKLGERRVGIDEKNAEVWRKYLPMKEARELQELEQRIATLRAQAQAAMDVKVPEGGKVIRGGKEYTNPKSPPRRYAPVPLGGGALDTETGDIKNAPVE